jgi:hypothetical protein
VSILIDPGAVWIEEAAPQFDLPAKVAPWVPGRADGPLDATGDGYLGANSPQLAAALCRRYPGLKIKALYTGSTLEHACAYDPKTGLAHDARGTFPTASSAFDSFGSNGARGATQVENPPRPQDGDSDADAYVARHWAPFENGSSSPPGDFQLDHDPDPDELDAALGGERRRVKSRVLDEALVLSEAIWNDKVHPRWPPGSHDANGHNISGQFMRVGQRFDKDGHEWEIAHVAGNKIIAHEASGDVHQAETRVFDTKKVGDVENSLAGAKPSKPRVLKSGFKKGTKSVIPDENSVVVDADRHEETHDPAIKPSPLSKLTPEQWSHFGRTDQLYYNAVMERFGAWEVNGKHPPPISSSGSQWSSKLSAITGEAPPDAVSTFQKEVSSLKGSTSGRQLSGVKAFDGLLNNPAALANAQAKYQRFREYEGDVNALLSWDLYNRLGSPDMTVIHRAGGAEVFKKALNGNATILSGLSTSWKTGSWSEPNSFVFALPVRQVGFFETLLGQGWGSGSGESELANIDRLKVGKHAGYYLNHEMQDPGYGGAKSQAGKMFKWVTDKLNKNGQGGWVADALKKHFNPNDPYTVDLGQVDANFQLKKAAGAKTYAIPPDNVMAGIEDALAANPGHPAWDQQKKFADWPEGKPQPGMIITKGGSQEGTRYLVIPNDALGPNEVQYVPLLTGSGDYDVNPGGGGYKTPQAKLIVGDDGKPLFFPLPPPPQERVLEHDMASLAPSGPAMTVGQMQVGDKVAVNDDHWKITKLTGGLATLESLSDGTVGTVDSLWKTQKLEPTGAGGPSFDPKAGEPALHNGLVVNVETVNVGPNKDVHIALPDGSTKTVPASTLAAAPTLPTLTPQKGDTFASGGVKFTVTNVMKDGTVAAKPPGGHVQKFPSLGAAETASMFRPDDYEPGAKQKLNAMAPGDLVSGSPAKVAPYMVLGTSGTKTHLKNLETGEVTGVSKNISYPALVGKGGAPVAMPHDAWKPGDKVNSDDLQIGDKINTGPAGADYTVTGQSTHQGEVGWQLEDDSGTDAWIGQNMSSQGGVKFTYLGKGEPTKPEPVSVQPSELQDAAEHGDLQAYKWHKGGGGQVYPKLNALKDNQHFYDKKGKLWKVKQAGEHPIVTDGEQLYTTKGNLHVKEAEPGTYTPLDDVTPEVSPPLSPAPTITEGPLLTANNNASLKTLGLTPGDKFTYSGQTWVVDALASDDSGNLSAHSEDMAAVKAFHGFSVPDSYSKAPTPVTAAPGHPLPPFLQSVGTHAGIPVTAAADSFSPNDLAQRRDGTIVYKSAPTGDHWTEVGGSEISIPDDEVLTPLMKTPDVPSTLDHSGESMDIHDIPAGQSFFAAGQPFLMLGHGPAGATGMSLTSGAILPAPADQHGNFALGTWNVKPPPGPTVPFGSPNSLMLQDYESGTPGQYGAWSIKKTTENGTGLFFHDMPVAWKAASGEHYVSDHPGDTWPGSTAPSEVISQLQADHPGHHAVPQSVLNAIPLADAGPGEVPPEPVHTGPTVPGPGVQLATSLVKGHHMKIKLDGKGAEYVVLETPKPGATSVPIQKLNKDGSVGKVYDWKFYGPHKQILVTKNPDAPPAPAPNVPHMVPNDKSIGELGLKGGDYFGDGGATFQIQKAGNFTLQAKNLDTGIVSTVNKGFVPEHAPPPPDEPTPPTPPSAPIPTTPLGTLNDLNVGDKYDYGPGTGYEVVAKGPNSITLKDTSQGFGGEHVLPLDTPFTSQPTITYKAPPPTGANAAGQLGGPPTMADMPIQPYLWHKSGSKSYPALSDLAPGEQFTDKTGAKHTVYKHNVKKLGDPVATTTVQTPSGGMVDIPHTFINPKGKVNVTHVNKLSTIVSKPTPAAPGADLAQVDAANAANDFLEGAGHSWPDIQQLHSEAEANVASHKYPSTWSPATTWAQAYTDAYVSTYGEDASTIDMGNSLFQAVKSTGKPAEPTHVQAFAAQTAAQALLNGDVKKMGSAWHTELVGPPQHATMVLYHGHGDEALPVAYSDENGKLHITPTTFKPDINKAVTYLKAQEPGYIAAASHSDLEKEIEAAAGPKPGPTTWADLRVGDLVKTEGSSSAPFKVTGEKGSQWEIESQHDGSKTTIPKDSVLPITVVGHEHVDPQAPLPTPINPQHAKAMRMADEWMKGQHVGPDTIASIHQSVAAFLAENPNFPMGDTYATAIGDKKGMGGLQVSSPWGANSLAENINKATKTTQPTYVSPHELGTGDVFGNDAGGQFKVTAKYPESGKIEFEKTSGAGAPFGTVHYDSPVKYQLISKYEPPTAEANEIPLPQNPAHEKAVNAADEKLLNVVPTSKTANWIHVRAAENRATYPGWSWGEAYAAATHEALPDQTPDELNALLDHIDAKSKGPLPKAEQLPQPTAGPAAGIPDYTSLTNAGANLTITGSAGGTTGAQKATDETGKKWLVKAYQGKQDRVATELLANAVYRAMGHKAADAGVIDTPEGKKLAYPLVDGQVKHWSGTDEAKMKALGQGVMTDALVGNWDFAGLEDDNVLWNGDEPTRIDQGGTFMFRAQGKPKDFGPLPLEVKSLLTGGGQGVKGVSVSEASLRAQAKDIAATMTPEKIDALVDAAPFKDQNMKQTIRENLKARVAWMKAFGDGQHSDMLQGVKLAPSPTPPPTPPPPEAEVTKVAADMPSSAPKFEVGHHVSYATDSGPKTGTITKDVSYSATQHAYQMDNGDKVDEVSIGGKVAKTPEIPKPEPPPPAATGPVSVGEMPINPYLWHKGGGGQTYPQLATLGPGAHFADKNGHEYLVTSNANGVTVAQRIIGGVPGKTVTIPHTFVNKKGKTQPAHVNAG